jgi:hypothetical protein
LYSHCTNDHLGAIIGGCKGTGIRGDYIPSGAMTITASFYSLNVRCAAKLSMRGMTMMTV